MRRQSFLYLSTYRLEEWQQVNNLESIECNIYYLKFPFLHPSIYIYRSIRKEFLINSPDRIETSINIHLVPMKSIHILIKLSFKISLSSDFFLLSFFPRDFSRCPVFPAASSKIYFSIYE